MTGTHQRRQVTATLIGVGNILSERSDPLAARKAQGCIEGLGTGRFADRRGRIGIDPNRAQRGRDPLFPEAAPGQRRPPGHRKARIVDIAELGTAFDDRIDGRLALAFPPP